MNQPGCRIVVEIGTVPYPLSDELMDMWIQQYENGEFARVFEQNRKHAQWMLKRERYRNVGQIPGCAECIDPRRGQNGTSNNE